MNVTVETTPESDAQFTVQIPWNEIDKISDRVYKRVAQTQKIPGFRPGHAPRALVERIVGKDAIYEEAIDIIVQDAVRSSATEHELTLLATPHAHVHEINYGEEHGVTVTVPVLARGELADYHDLAVTQAEVVITDEDIDQVITRARESSALQVPVDRPAAIGDRVTVDLKLTINDKPINDLKDHEFDLVEDRTGLFTGMDQQIVGMTDGETKEFTTTLPEDYAKTDMAGKPANYVVTLNKITIKELPAVDDEFAKQVGGGDTVEALRESVRTDLQRGREQTSRRKARERLIDKLIARLTLTIPPVLVEAEADDLIQELSNTLANQQINLAQYLQMMGKNPEQYRDEMKPEALRRIQQRRALELVAIQEGMQTTPQDLQILLDAYATQGGQRLRVNQLKSSQRLSLEQSLLRDKALEWLADQYITIGQLETVDDESTDETDATDDVSLIEGDAADDVTTAGAKAAAVASATTVVDAESPAAATEISASSEQ